MSESREYRPEELFDEILLSMIDGIGPLTTRRLLERFGTASAILAAKQDELRSVSGVGEKISRQIVSAHSLYKPEELIALCEREKIGILGKVDSRYPRRLLEIADAPPILYVKGEPAPEDAMALAVVGTRGMSAYGRRMTTFLAGALARAGVTVVSGLAAGIDAAAHTAALDANGRTVAVLGSGLLEIYPPQHRELAERIVENGAIYSELHPKAAPLAGNFPQRNRIVSGLSLGVLVVESPRKSGSLITARLAMEQNREVFAVPGPIDSENSRGCHQLIKDGAKLVESAFDILDELGPLPLPAPTGAKEESLEEIRHAAELTLNEREKSILALIAPESTPLDEIIRQSSLTVPQVIAVISVLEMKRLVVRGEGGKISRR